MNKTYPNWNRGFRHGSIAVLCLLFSEGSICVVIFGSVSPQVNFGQYVAIGLISLSAPIIGFIHGAYRSNGESIIESGTCPCDPPVTNHTDPNLNSTHHGSNKLKNVLITKEILALYDKYEGEFGLMDERWADKRDSDKITSKQAHLFSQYIYNLRVIKNKHYSDQLKDKAMNENAEIEFIMDDEVGRTLREREKYNEHPVS